MAAKDRQKRETMAQEILHIFFVVNVFHCLTPSLASVESPNQVFVQTDNELRYLGEGGPIKVVPEDSIHDINILSEASVTSSLIRFEPQQLDFKQQPVGMPRMEKVTVHNADTDNNLHLLSISGSTQHFHCSFFQDKLVPPGGNTTFDVVFLAREVGGVQNTLYIHTLNQGSYKYQVFGTGMPNPYRIRPFVGAKVPLNSSFSPLIKMHNPHSSVLQVEEIYTTGGDLHLELPSGDQEGTSELWEIRPYETKPIMKASFIGRTENNHTAFIRIKTNRENRFILPVEVEVTAAPGIFSPLEVLDFGIIRTFDEPKTLRLNLLNSGVKPVYISNVTVSPPNGAIHIDFRPVQLKPNLIQSTFVARVYYTASKATDKKQWTGKIIVKSKGGSYKLSIPYQANVLHGSLVYDRNKTMFYTGQPSPKNISRDLPITNTFNFTLVIYNVTFSSGAAAYFSVENFTSALTVLAGRTTPPLLLRFHPNATLLHFTTHLNLHTNASIFSIPIYVYNGRLKVVHHRPEIFSGQLDFGTLGMEERRSMTFTLRNDNPLEVLIHEFGANMDRTTVSLLGLEKGNATMLTQEQNTSQIDINPLVLKPYHFAVFSVDLIAPDWEGTFAAEVIMVTQFETLYIPMTLRTAEGSLTAQPEKALFERCFPSKVSETELRIYSSFEQLMDVRSLTFQPNDTRFYFVPPPKQKNIVLEPHRDNYIGRLHFDPRKACGDDCYTGFLAPLSSQQAGQSKTLGYQWLLGLGLGREVADIDQFMFTRAQHHWDYHNFQQLSTVNVTMQLDTNQVRGFLFPVQAHLHWPTLSRRAKIKFPLTQIGNISVSDFILENPGDSPVLVQVLPLSIYPNQQTLLDMAAKRISSDLIQLIETDDHNVFTLPDLEINNPSSTNTVPRSRRAIEQQFGVKPHTYTIPLLVPGSARVKISVGFRPMDDQPKTSLIIIRNNLTVIDTVVLYGQGGRGEMKFSTRRSGSQTPLMFEMTEKHLKHCDTKKRSKSIPPSFTVKRTFTARNTGQLPFFVSSFSINNAACEGYGFRVLDCQGFQLLPNSSKKVDIAFTPDFTMSRIRRTLTIHTSLGAPLNFTLQATVPAHMLTKCASALPRLNWEPILYYSTICIMGFLLFCIFIAAYFEADRIYTTDIIKRRNQMFDRSKMFNLRALAQQEISSQVSTPKTTPDIPNGHSTTALPAQAVFPRKKKESSSLLRGFLKLISRRPSTSSARETTTLKPPPAPVVRQNSSERGKSPNPNGNGVLKSNGTSNNNRTEKSSFVDRLLGRKTPIVKAKAVSSSTDVSNSDTVTNAVISNSTSDRRPHQPQQQNNSHNSTNYSNANVSHSNNNRKKSHNKEQTSDALVHTYKQPEPEIRERIKVCKRQERVAAAPILPEPTSSITNIDKDDDTPREGKRAKLRKSRAEARREEQDERERERRLKDRLFKEKVLQELERDDSSSTTTETSSLDPEDKASSARDSTPELNVHKSKKQKIKGKKSGGGGRGSSVTTEDDDASEDVFVVTNKSKPHRRINKMDAKNMLGGDIMEPSSYELPYTTRLEAETKQRNAKKEQANLQSNATVDKHHRRSQRLEKNKPAGRESVLHTPPGERANESPPPMWDTPKTTGDLSDLALQTQQFLASNRSAAASPTVSTPTTPLPMSYSGAVSGNANDQTRSKKTRSPVSEASRGQGQGTNGRGASSLQQPPPQIGMPPITAWSMPTPKPAEKIESNSFGLNPIHEGDSMVSGLAADGDNLMPPNSMFDGLRQFGYSSSIYDQPGVGVSANAHSPFSMQSLQAQRRQRSWMYQQNLLSNVNPNVLGAPSTSAWPGFDTPVTKESFWDPGSSSAWSTQTHSPPKPKASSALWNESVNNNGGGHTGTGQNWVHPTSIWSNAGTSANSLAPGAPMLDSLANNGQTLSTGMIAPGGMDGGNGLIGSNLSGPGGIVGGSCPGGIAGGSGGISSSALSVGSVDERHSPNSPTESMPGFDPFSTLGNIWNPTSSSSSGPSTPNSWGFTPRSDQDN